MKAKTCNILHASSIVMVFRGTGLRILSSRRLELLIKEKTKHATTAYKKSHQTNASKTSMNWKKGTDRILHCTFDQARHKS